MSFPTIPTFDCLGRGLSRRRGTRSGLSIVEVLTSIVVAMIGVFGVMILIPFAVKQAQTGLDSDAAVTTARNAVSQMELAGLQFPQNWQVGGSAYSLADGPEIFSLDPLAVTETNVAQFPFRGNLPGALPLRAANFRDPGGRAFDLEMARRMCRSANDLVFEDTDISDIAAGPSQLFDRESGGGIPLRRQSNGRISWSSIVVPFKSSGVTGSDTDRWSYQMYILVYKNREFGNEGSMQSGLINGINGGRIIGVRSPIGNVTGVPDAAQRDDWVMLINQNPNLEAGFDKQLAFCRVVNKSGNRFTLDGPDFDFGPEDPMNPGTPLFDTHVVHLNGVVGVYERTFTPEQDSNWNLTN